MFFRLCPVRFVATVSGSDLDCKAASQDDTRDVRPDPTAYVPNICAMVEPECRDALAMFRRLDSGGVDRWTVRTFGRVPIELCPASGVAWI